VIVSRAVVVMLSTSSTARRADHGTEEHGLTLATPVPAVLRLALVTLS
jgi:hypothetical protein